MTLETDPILSDDEVATLNEARSLLAAFADRCTERSFTARSYPGPEDYGRVQAAAIVAAEAIFRTLNWASSYDVQPLTDAQLNNRQPRRPRRTAHSPHGAS